MTFFEALFLGIVQGIAEFLPISSSGHLALFQQLFKISEPVVFFDVILHVATLGSLIVYFWKVLFKLKFIDFVYIGIGTIPAVLVGLFLKDQIEGLFNNSLLIGVALIITGCVNLISNFVLKKKALNDDAAGEDKSSLTGMTFAKAFIIGIFQAVAITPGISRSGSTLAGGLWQKLSKETSFNFAFLLAIPAILGALVLQLKDFSEMQFSSAMLANYIIGFVAAFIFGFLGLVLLNKILTKTRLDLFGYYCLGIGTFAIVVSSFIAR